MIISKKSWHYRLNQFMALNTRHIKPPERYNSLCTYFWYTVGSLFCSIFYGIVALGTYKIPKTPKCALDDSDITEAKRCSEPLNVFFLSLAFLILVPATAAEAIHLLLLVPLYAAIAAFRFGFDTLSAQWHNPAIFVSLTLYGILSFIFAVAFIFVWIHNLRQFANNQPENLVVQFAKAKKNKLCPRIEFQD